MAVSELGGLALVGAAAVVAPMAAAATGRLAVPSVAVEIGAGVLIGPAVLHWVVPTGVLVDLANFGLALLMFLAGFECDPAVLRGRPLVRAGWSWLGSLLLAAAAVGAAAAAGHGRPAIIIGIVCCTTALGILLPVLGDGGLLAGPLGRPVLAVGSVGEFAPIVLIALLLGGHGPFTVLAVLALFAGVVALAVFAARHRWSFRFRRFTARHIHSPSQLPVRVSMLMITAFVLLAGTLGIDVLLGSFAAGVVLRIAIRDIDDARWTADFQSKMQAVGFGFLVPVFFVVSGMRLNFMALGIHPSLIAIIPATLVAFLVVRGLPTFLVWRDLRFRMRCALALFAATALPLVVVTTTLGVAIGAITSGVATALVAGALLSVLLYPGIGRWLITSEPAARQHIR